MEETVRGSGIMDINRGVDFMVPGSCFKSYMKISGQKDLECPISNKEPQKSEDRDQGSRARGQKVRGQKAE